MKDSIKKALPACLGSSFAVILIQFFRHPGIWRTGDFLLSFIITFIITLVIVTLCFRIKGIFRRKRKNS